MSIFEYNEEEELKKFGGKAESVILALEMKGPVSEQMKKRIFSERDISLLEDWMRTAIEADTVEAFLVRTGLDRII